MGKASDDIGLSAGRSPWIREAGDYVMKSFLPMIAGAAMLSATAGAQTPKPASAPAAAAPAAVSADALIRTFLSGLQSGKAEEAVDGLITASTVPSSKPGERDTMLNQINAALQAYGPIVSFEKAKADMLGTLATRQYYLVQHRDMVVRWEFTIVRTGAGWRIDYFGFDDQPRTWF